MSKLDVYMTQSEVVKSVSSLIKDMREGGLRFNYLKNTEDAPTQKKKKTSVGGANRARCWKILGLAATVMSIALLVIIIAVTHVTQKMIFAD